MQPSGVVAWTEKYRPQTAGTILGNEETADAFKAWMKQWTLKRKPTKACLLVGPPGVGKTTLARAAAGDFGFRVVEMNASDIRTEKAINNTLAPATGSTSLDVFSSRSQGNLILLDEVDGVFGREDRGGLGAILAAIKDMVLPIVLTANNIEDERFDDLRRVCTVLTLYPVRPRLVVILINSILAAEDKSLPATSVKYLAEGTNGDLRSVINDAQAMAISGVAITSRTRTRELNERETLHVLFGGMGFGASRRALNETEIPLYRDELLLLIHDVLPYIYTAPEKLSRAYDALSKADMGYGKVGASRSRGMMPPPFNLPRRDRTPEWSLLPVALNELASIGLEQADQDLNHALEVAPRVSQKMADRFQYRLWALDHLCSRITRVCHLSKRKALRSIVPALEAIFRMDSVQGREVAASLELEERDIEFLVSESRVQAQPSGPQELLDASGFRLPYMGKDKFIQLMRAGINYDRNSGRFVVRRLDNLDAAEERLSQILGKPVKFARANQETQVVKGSAVQECYVDGRQVPCAKCDFIDSCPTHMVPTVKFCLCDETLADPNAYAEYVAKNSSHDVSPKAKSTRRPATHKKRLGAPG